MILKFSIKNLLTRSRRSLISIFGISISIALFVSVALICKSAKQAFSQPLEDAGADMIVQLGGEPCVWSIVKLPSNLNPIPSKIVEEIKSLNEVASADGALIAWAFSNSPMPQMHGGQPGGMPREDAMSKIGSGELQGEPCDYGPPGSFCNTSGGGGMPDFSPIVIAGVNTGSGGIGPVKASDIKNIQGQYFSPDDKNTAILDRDFAATRKLKAGDNIDLGQRNFKVIGVIESGRDAKIAGAQAFIPLKTAIEMVGRGDIVDIIFVKLKGGIDAREAKKKMQAKLPENATITISDDYMSAIAGFSNLTQGFMLAMASIAILICLAFIVKTAFGSALERTNEIGILKAIGWRDKDISRLIIIENIILGLIGGLLGSLFGYAVSLIYKINLPAILPYYLNPYPPCSQHLVKNILKPSIPFSVNIFLYAILLAVIIETVSGLAASKKILKLTPADAIRKIS